VASALWSLERTQLLGPKGSEAVFEGIQLLDEFRFGSVTDAVDSLNQGDVLAEAGFCVVFSKSQQAYFLIWQEALEDAAFSSLTDLSTVGPQESPALEEDTLVVSAGVANGCACVYNIPEAVARGALRHDDNMFEHYRSQGRGLWGLLGLGSKPRTMFCHHFTSLARGGMFAARAAKDADKHFRSVEEVWAFLGKSPCCGYFRPDGSSQDTFTCSPVALGEHDNTCTPETCLFLANYLPCPVPDRACR